MYAKTAVNVPTTFSAVISVDQHGFSFLFDGAHLLEIDEEWSPSSAPDARDRDKQVG